MSYFATMRRSISKRHLLGLLLCALLVFFAVEAKASGYGAQKKEVSGLTSTKVWQNDGARVIPAASALQVTVALAFALLLSTPAFAVKDRGPLDAPRVPSLDWFSPDLSVRPPPTL